MESFIVAINLGFLITPVLGNEGTNSGAASGGLNTSTAVGIAITMLVIGCLIVLAVFILERRDRAGQLKKYGSEMALSTSSAALETYTYGQTSVLAVPGYLNVELEKVVRLGEKIAEGGEGIIFNADVIDDQFAEANDVTNVIVKMFKTKDRTRFTSELGITKLLSKYPNMVKFYAYSDEPMAMILHAYPMNLQKLMFGNQIAESDWPAFVKKFITQVANGLATMHSLGMVHNDIKRTNILIDEIQQGSQIVYQPIIADFGLTSVMEGARNVATGFKANTVLGLSVPYAAPEVLRSYENRASKAEYVYESDIYSFGILIYELITKQNAWGKLSNEEITQEVLKGNRPNTNEIDKKVWAKEVKLIERCWSESIADRPSALAIASGK